MIDQNRELVFFFHHACTAVEFGNGFRTLAHLFQDTFPQGIVEGANGTGKNSSGWKHIGRTHFAGMNGTDGKDNGLLRVDLTGQHTLPGVNDLHRRTDDIRTILRTDCVGANACQCELECVTAGAGDTAFDQYLSH